MQYERGGDAVLSRCLGMKMADFGLSKSIQDGETILTVYISILSCIAYDRPKTYLSKI